MRTNLLLISRINPRLLLAVLSAFCLLVLPDIAVASGGITEFSSPLEKVVNTITGPAGKWIAITAMALCGVIFIMNNDDNNTFLPSEEVYFIYNNQYIIGNYFPLSSV